MDETIRREFVAGYIRALVADLSDEQLIAHRRRLEADESICIDRPEEWYAAHVVRAEVQGELDDRAREQS